RASRPAGHTRGDLLRRRRVRRRRRQRRTAASADRPSPATGGARMSRSRRILLGAAVFVLAVVAAMALFPGVIAPADPLQTNVRAALETPSAAHWFGTDQSGRDVFSRVVHGAGRSVGIGLLATALALVIGLVIGALSGIAPRPVDAVAMRLNDVLMAFPEFLVALVVVAILGPGPEKVAIAVTIAAIPVYVRLARVQTRTLALAEHV